MTATTDTTQVRVGDRLTECRVVSEFTVHVTGFGFRRYAEVALVDDRPLCQVCKQRRAAFCAQYGEWPDPDVRYCLDPACGSGGVRCVVARRDVIGLDS